MASTAAKANHISNTRAAYAKLLEARDTLAMLVAEAADNGYVFAEPADFQGSNSGILKADYDTALVQASNVATMLVSGGTLPSGLRGVFSKVAK